MLSAHQITDCCLHSDPQYLATLTCISIAQQKTEEEIKKENQEKDETASKASVKITIEIPKNLTLNVSSGFTPCNNPARCP